MMARRLGKNDRTNEAMEYEHEKALFPLAENILTDDEKEELERLFRASKARHTAC